MTNDDFDLWPTDLAVDVVPPLVILNEQAEALSKRTGGIIKVLMLQSSVGPFVQHSLDLWAPAIGFRHRLLLVRYDQTMPYPVVVIAEPLSNDLDHHDLDQPDQSTWKLSEIETKQARLAYTPKDVRDLLKKIFNSPTIRPVLFSMVARSNEVKLLLPNESNQAAEPKTNSGTETVKQKGNGTPDH